MALPSFEAPVKQGNVAESNLRRALSLQQLIWIGVGAGLFVCSACDGTRVGQGEIGKRRTMDTKKGYPGTVRTVLPGARRGVVVANPRKKGGRTFVSPDGHQESDRTNAAQVELLRYRVGLIQLVQLKDGRIVDPVMLVKYPRRNESSVDLEDAWSVEYQGIVPFEAPDDGWAHFAVSDRIQKYILLLEAPEEKTGWRVLELKPEKIAKVKTLHIPDLLTLTPLEKHADGKQLWKIHLAGEKEEDRLKLLE